MSRTIYRASLVPISCHHFYVSYHHLPLGAQRRVKLLAAFMHHHRTNFQLPTLSIYSTDE
eukprot:scaffold800_cov87-Skeletonema_menzelii.AAC.2